MCARARSAAESCSASSASGSGRRGVTRGWQDGAHGCVLTAVRGATARRADRAERRRREQSVGGAVAVPVEEVDPARRRRPVGGLPVGEHVEVLDRDRHARPAGGAERACPAHAGSVLEVERARHLLELVRLLGVRRRDDVAVLVLRDREQAVHLLDLGAASSRPHGAMRSSRSSSMLTPRMYERIAASARRARSTGAMSPAVNSSAR